MGDLPMPSENRYSIIFIFCTNEKTIFLTLKNFRLDGSSLLEFLDDQDEYKPKIYGNIEDWASGPKNKSFD